MTGSLVPRALGGAITPISSTHINRALVRVEERTLVRSAEIQGVAYVGQTALRGVAEVSLAEAELAKLAPPEARLRLAAVGDAATAAIQARVLDLIEGL